MCTSRDVHRVSSSPLGPVVPSFRALAGRLKFTVRRHKFNTDSLSSRGVLLIVFRQVADAGAYRPGGNPGANR